MGSKATTWPATGQNSQLILIIISINREWYTDINAINFVLCFKVQELIQSCVNVFFFDPNLTPFYSNTEDLGT